MRVTGMIAIVLASLLAGPIATAAPTEKAGVTPPAGASASKKKSKKKGTTPPRVTPRSSKKAPKCDGCEYACMYAMQIVDSDRQGWLFSQLGPIVKERALDRVVMEEKQKLEQETKVADRPAYACLRWLMSDKRKPEEKKSDEELTKVLEHLDLLGQGEVMGTDFSTPGCKIDTKGLEKKVCKGLYESVVAHEMAHHDSCKKAWADPEIGKDAVLIQKNPKLRGAEEARAYEAGRRRMEKEMMELAKKKGCGLEDCTSGNLAPPPTEEEQARALRDIEALPSILKVGGR